MAGCKAIFTTMVPRGYSMKVVKATCGTVSHDGGTNLCDSCMERYKQEYPQGWREVPGDICQHGTYVGDAGGPDYLCGYCEAEDELSTPDQEFKEHEYHAQKPRTRKE